MDTKTHTIYLEDKRKIRIIEAGQPNGILILVHNGTPGSRLLYQPWIEDAENRGIRLISYECPGYGGSSRLIGRTVASAAADVASIAEDLNF